MKLKIHTVNFDADKKLLAYVRDKVGKLETYFSNFVDGEVFLKLTNDKITNKTVEILLNAPGHQLFAKDQGRKFETACNRAVDSLSKQVRKLKTKFSNGRI